MLFRKKKNKNTNSQITPTQDKVFMFIYKGSGKNVIEIDPIIAKYEYEAVEQFTHKHPNNEQFAYTYDFVDPDTGKTYTFKQNWGYAEYLERIARLRIIKSEQLIVDKKPKQDQKSNLQPLYYKKNNTYHESGIYINPSELKHSDLFPELPEETD